MDHTREARAGLRLALILQIACSNPRWGYACIADALANLGHRFSDQTADNILKANGYEPAP